MSTLRQMVPIDVVLFKCVTSFEVKRAGNWIYTTL